MPARSKRQPSGPAAPGVISGWRKNYRRAQRNKRFANKHDRGVAQNSGKPAPIRFSNAPAVGAGGQPVKVVPWDTEPQGILF